MYITNYLARLISATYRHQMAFLNRKLTPYHLGGGSYLFLLTIKEKPGITQNELSRELLIDKATTSKMLARLEAEAMIERVPNPSDRRAVILTITPKGDAVYEDLIREAAIYREKMLVGVDPAERAIAERVLTRILDNIKAENDAAGRRP